jgi:hypothetical protein
MMIYMNVQMIVSSIIGFVPAVLLLFILLRRYEEFFKESKIFQAFAAGMILGMFFTAVHMAFDGQILEYLDLSFLGFVILFPLFEQSIKLVILNYPKLQLKHQTVYYGAALGLGIGSMAVIAISYKFFLDYPESLANPLQILVFVVLSFNYSLLHSATGIIIGYGSTKGYAMRWFFRAFLIHAVYNFTLLPLMWGVAGALYGSLLVATMIAIVVFFYVLRDLMPEAVPPEMMRKRRREHRKRVREERTK